MSNSYDIPSTPLLVQTPGQSAPPEVATAWQQFFQRTHANARTVQQSGTTAQRPTDLLWIGRFYFDTTLTKPIWIKAVSASKVATWCDATGATV